MFLFAKFKVAITCIVQAIRIIWGTEGAFGFYKGMHAQILKTVLAAALMLMIKEKVADGSRNAILTVYNLLKRVERAHPTSIAGVLQALPIVPPHEAGSVVAASGSMSKVGPSRQDRSPSVVSSPLHTSRGIHQNGSPKSFTPSDLQDMALMLADDGSI